MLLLHSRSLRSAFIYLFIFHKISFFKWDLKVLLIFTGGIKPCMRGLAICSAWVLVINSIKVVEEQHDSLIICTPVHESSVAAEICTFPDLCFSQIISYITLGRSNIIQNSYFDNSSNTHTQTHFADLLLRPASTFPPLWCCLSSNTNWADN